MIMWTHDYTRPVVWPTACAQLYHPCNVPTQDSCFDLARPYQYDVGGIYNVRQFTRSGVEDVPNKIESTKLPQRRA